MTTINAVPSSDVSDFVFNVQKLDEIVSSGAAEYTDRLGVTRLTAVGATNRVAALNPRGPWATATAYQPRDLVLESGTWYIALDAHTSGAMFAGDLTAHWRPEQGVTAADLYDVASATKGAGLTRASHSLNYVAGTLGAKYKDFVSVKDHPYLATGDGVTDDTAAVQAAINSGKSLVFPAGTYLCNNLTQSTDYQRFYAHGNAILQKNANGPVLTASGHYLEFVGMACRGGASITPGFTGDNLVVTGNHPRFLNCSSYWAAGRALKATGAHVQVIGTNNVYHTIDQTSTGYDIEIGVDGTATLYHHIAGVYTSQIAGGILFIDTGGQSITGSQFGKLTVKRGVGGYINGCSGGQFAANRINGDVSMGQSNSSFDACQFSSSSCNFTFETGISGGAIGPTCSAPLSYTNLGSSANINLSQGTTQSTPTYQNNTYMYWKDSGGTSRVGIGLSSGNDWQFGSITGTGNFTTLVSDTGGVYLLPNAASTVQCTTAVFRPVVDNTIPLGGAANRWSELFCGNGTINTSDSRSKDQITELSDAERRVALKCKALLRKYKMRDAVAKKGNAARWHVGVVAQDVIAAFASEGLDANEYGILCYDKWDAASAVVGEAGEMFPAVDAGDRYGIRYDELLTFILGAM